MQPAVRWLDRLLVAVLTVLYLSFLVSSVFSRRDWNDTIAYGLPGANLVVRGALTLPQLGSQFAFDRYWLFNAPFTVLGDVPWFLVGGVGRIPYLLGIVVIGALNLIVFTIVCRRLLHLASLALAMLVAFAFLGTRGVVVSHLYNQTYAVATAGLLLLVFAPLGNRSTVRGRRWWQWLAASLLPMVHLVLAPMAIVWLLTAAIDWYREKATSPHAARRSIAGPIAFAIGAAANLAWYGRVTPFMTQLWPHIHYGGFRLVGPLSGFLDTAASPIASVPTWILHGLVVCAAIVIVGTAARGRRHRQQAAALPAALAIVVLLPLDLWRGFLYYAYVLVGVGPALLAAATTTQLRRGALVGLVLIAIANMGLSSRLDRYPPDWTTTAAGDRFLVEHTRAGDRIVLAPPFVFTAATAAPTRDVRRIVPQPYFLETFDRAAWIRDLNACCDVYLGREEFLREPVTRRPPGDPFFSDASIEHLEFRGEPVIVARRRAP